MWPYLACSMPNVGQVRHNEYGPDMVMMWPLEAYVMPDMGQVRLNKCGPDLIITWPDVAHMMPDMGQVWLNECGPHLVLMWPISCQTWARWGIWGLGQTWYWCGQNWPGLGQFGQYGAPTDIGHTLPDLGQILPELGQRMKLQIVPALARPCQQWLTSGPVVLRGAGRVVGQGGQLFSKGHFLTIAPDLTLP